MELLDRGELLVRIGAFVVKPSPSDFIGLLRLASQLARRRPDDIPASLRALRRGGLNAALIHLQEAERRYPRDGWRTDVEDARRSLIQALGVEMDADTSLEHRADIEMQLALVCSLLEDREGVVRWLQDLGATLCREYADAAVKNDEAEAFISQISAVLLEGGDEPVFSLPSLERPTAPSRDPRESWFYQMLLRIGFEEVEETEWTDPRSDPIGWG